MLICFLTPNPHDGLIAKRHDQRSVIISSARSHSAATFVCTLFHFISLYFSWIAFVSCHQWQPIQKNPTNYSTVYFVQTYMLKENHNKRHRRTNEIKRRRRKRRNESSEYSSTLVCKLLGEDYYLSLTYLFV